MARENSFIFFGRSVNAPVAFFNEDSKTYRLTFTVETFRRNGRKDYPTINVYSLNEGEAKRVCYPYARSGFHRGTGYGFHQNGEKAR